jgi:hypothetical protein
MTTAQNSPGTPYRLDCKSAGLIRVDGEVLKKGSGAALRSQSQAAVAKKLVVFEGLISIRSVIQERASAIINLQRVRLQKWVNR